jgi:hypothetical protein
VDGVNAKVYSSDARQAERVAQQVRVLEGGRAFSLGQSCRFAIARSSIRRTDAVVETTGFSEGSSGFYVPRVAGDRVALEISQLTTRCDHLAQVLPIFAGTDVVSARLGEWVEIGGIGQHGILEESQALTRSTDARRDQRRVMLKSG